MLTYLFEPHWYWCKVYEHDWHKYVGIELSIHLYVHMHFSIRGTPWFTQAFISISYKL